MVFATISADVISYTSLKEKDKRNLEKGIKELLSEFTSTYGKSNFFGRLIQGDYIECAVRNPAHALRIALLLKTFVKSFEPEEKYTGNQMKYFKEHGLRLAVAVATLDRFDPKKGIIDGEAIYMSGRTIKSHTTSGKQKIVIKNTMFFCTDNEEMENRFNTIFSLLDTIISGCSVRQSEILYLKLSGLTEKEISKKLGKYQSTISQHSTAAGWLSIEQTVNYYENIFR